jgi:transcriptional regulator with XRE-family HTH domain
MTEQERRTAQGKRVLMARAGAGLSRQKMAEAVSELWEPISRDYIRRIEIGEVDPGLGFLLAAAEVTDQPLAWFIDLNFAKGVYGSWEQLALAV